MWQDKSLFCSSLDVGLVIYGILLFAYVFWKENLSSSQQSLGNVIGVALDI
jgi:hypothetical protein